MQIFLVITFLLTLYPIQSSSIYVHAHSPIFDYSCYIQGDYSRIGFQSTLIAGEVHTFAKLRLYKYWGYSRPDVHPPILFVGDKLIVAFKSYRGSSRCHQDIVRNPLVLQVYRISKLSGNSLYLFSTCYLSELEGISLYYSNGYIYVSGLYMINSSWNWYVFKPVIYKCSLTGCILWKNIIDYEITANATLYHNHIMCSYFARPYFSIFTFSGAVYVIESISPMHFPKVFILDDENGSTIEAFNLFSSYDFPRYYSEILISIRYGKMYCKALQFTIRGIHRTPENVIISAFSIHPFKLLWAQEFHYCKTMSSGCWTMFCMNFVVEDFQGRLCVPTITGLTVFNEHGDLIGNYSFFTTRESIWWFSCIGYSHLFATSPRLSAVAYTDRIIVLDRSFRVLKEFSYPLGGFVFCLYSLCICWNVIFISFLGNPFSGILLMDFNGNIIWERYVSTLYYAALVGNYIVIVTEYFIEIYSIRFCEPSIHHFYTSFSSYATYTPL